MKDHFLFARALAAFIALPGLVAFVVPLLLLRPPNRAFTAGGMVLAVAGGLILLACVWEFYAAGRGTLAPWSPPRRLVRTGLYRYSRNPMYIGVLVVLTAWAVGFSSNQLGAYAAAVAVAFHLRILLHEEPWLARTFGEEWQKYRQQVPRWLLPTVGG